MSFLSLPMGDDETDSDFELELSELAEWALELLALRFFVCRVTQSFDVDFWIPLLAM